MRYGRSVLYSSECDDLSVHIFEITGQRISAQTLRRILGFIKSDVKQSLRTLNTLSNYCGYKDYSELMLSKKSAQKEKENSVIDLIKKFYQIEHLDINDFSYHSASGNFAKVILKSQRIATELQSFLSKDKVAQIYFFERFPYIDGVSNSYRNLIRLYLQEKKEPSAQMFGYCLLHLGSILTLNKKESRSTLNKINSIGFQNDFHPFLKGRFIMENLLEAYLNKDTESIHRYTKLAFELEKKEKRGKENGVIFPYYQYILADAFNLIEDYSSSNKMISICELDYNRIAVGKIASGYYEALDHIKAINLAYLGRIEDSNRILNRIRPTDVIFIQHEYFLIQRHIAELLNCTAKRKKKVLEKLEVMIENTNFQFFRSRIKY